MEREEFKRKWEILDDISKIRLKVGINNLLFRYLFIGILFNIFLLELAGIVLTKFTFIIFLIISCLFLIMLFIYIYYKDNEKIERFFEEKSFKGK